MLTRCLALATLFALAACSAYGPPRVAGERLHRGVVFASPGGRDLRLDLYVPPAGARPAPVVIWIFGGSWRFGSRGYHVNVRDLTRAGIAVASIDYRLSGEAKFPAQLADVTAALRWLETNGPCYDLDPRRIGVAGESAGGHLAALLALGAGRDRIRAALLLYPVTDLVDIGRQYAERYDPTDIERLLGGPIEERLPAARAASPINLVVKNVPPTFFITGARDTLVPIRHSERLHARLRSVGGESTLLLVPDRGHWFSLDGPQREAVARFFRRHLKESGPRNPALR